MIDTQKHLELLGMRVQDRVTGIKGVVESVKFDVDGKVHAVFIDENQVTQVLSTARLRVTSIKPTMQQPVFDTNSALIASVAKETAEACFDIANEFYRHSAAATLQVNLPNPRPIGFIGLFGLYDTKYLLEYGRTCAEKQRRAALQLPMPQPRDD